MLAVLGTFCSVVTSCVPCLSTADGVLVKEVKLLKLVLGATSDDHWMDDHTVAEVHGIRPE